MDFRFISQDFKITALLISHQIKRGGSYHQSRYWQKSIIWHIFSSFALLSLSN